MRSELSGGHVNCADNSINNSNTGGGGLVGKHPGAITELVK